MATPFYNDPNYYLNGPKGANQSTVSSNLAAQAAQYGMTSQQLAQYMADNGAANPSNAVQAQTTGYGMTQSVANPNDNASMNQTLNTLATMQKYGLGQSAAPPPPQFNDSTDAQTSAQRLGAQALQQNAIYNPTPGTGMMNGNLASGGFGGSGFNQSGVNPVQPAMESSGVPAAQEGPWNNVAGVLTNNDQAAANQLYAQYGGQHGSPSDIATFYKGMTGIDINNPSLSKSAPPQGAFTAVRPANAPGAQAPATPFATAPPAPGANAAMQPMQPAGGSAPPPAPTGTPPIGAQAPPGVSDEAHNTALAHAGMAMYQHYGGDPSSATHQDIAGFHQQLLSSLGSIVGGGIPGGAPATGMPAAGPPPAPGPAANTALSTGANALRMSSGGVVPGHGNRDTVPALLTPGEVVIPKDGVLRMSEGGEVPDSDNQSPEAKHVALMQAAKAAQAAQLAQAPAQASASQAPPAPGLGGGMGSDPNSLMNQIQQAKANSMGNLSNGTYQSGGGTTVGQVADGAPTGATPGVAQDLGTAPAPGAQAQGAASAVGSLASGLASAAQTYANSVKAWQIQPDETEKFGKNVAPAAPVTLRQTQLGDTGKKQGQQQEDPYAFQALGA